MVKLFPHLLIFCLTLIAVFILMNMFIYGQTFSIGLVLRAVITAAVTGPIWMWVANRSYRKKQAK